MLAWPILGIYIKKYDLLLVTISKVYEPIAILTGTLVLMVGQTQLNDNNRVVNKYHITIVTNLIYRSSGKCGNNLTIDPCIYPSLICKKTLQATTEDTDREKSYPNDLTIAITSA